MQKRVLIVDQYFYPESFRINELGYELVKRGYHVDALVGIPNYPEGKYYKGYGLFSKRRETYKGVNIYRCFQIPRGNSSNLMVSLNYLSYLFCASLWILFFFSLRKKYDVVIGFQLSPITQVIPGILLKKIRGSKMLTWVQDIWPDSITDNTSEKQNKVLLPILNSVTEYVYRNSDLLLVSSKKMNSLICRSEDYSSKIIYVPNWCDDFSVSKEKLEIDLPKGFNIMMAGNLGEGIGPDDVINLIKELSDLKDVNFLFAGAGSREIYMKEKVKEFNLPNVYFLGRFPYHVMGEIYNIADALLLTLKQTDLLHLDVTVPSRLQAYMSSGKPVYAMIGSGAREVIELSDCGFVVDAGDYKGLAGVIRNTYMNSDLLKEKGVNARMTFEKEFTLERGVERFEQLINI